MDKVVIEPAIRSRLHGLDTELESRDESGRVLGDFVPRLESVARHYEWARGQFADEEIAHARREPDGRTTAEALGGLGGP